MVDGKEGGRVQSLGIAAKYPAEVFDVDTYNVLDILQ